jgi:hypothetical protein
MGNKFGTDILIQAPDPKIGGILRQSAWIRGHGRDVEYD